VFQVSFRLETWFAAWTSSFFLPTKSLWADALLSAMAHDFRSLQCRARRSFRRSRGGRQNGLQ